MSSYKRIGKYPLVRQIGDGTMGQVYQGFDPDTGAKVAIKILRAEHLSDEQADSAAARFEREAQIGLELRHPNIVAVHEHGRQGRIRYIVMEFVEGRELRHLIRQQGRLSLADAAGIVLQLLDALACSHERGIVHRDIKPANVMVIDPLRVKVLDFGIARLAGAQFTQVGTVLGTLNYMSPEQMCGFPVDLGSDLWAAGVILYELLSGRVPFGAPTSGEVIRRAVNLPHAPLSRLMPGLPPAIDGVLARALAKPREGRFPSAAAFARALSEALVARPAVADLELDIDISGA